MPMAFKASALLSLALLGIGAAQDAQAPAPPPVLRITVTLVQVDAVVTDSAGRHVSGLRPEDFEILQDGQAQKLTYFSYYSEDSAPPVKAARTGERAPIGPAPPIAPDQVKRTVALVVDDLAVREFGTLTRLRDALREYVRQRMQPGDLVALIKTGGGIAALEQFTGDRQLLLESINELTWKVWGAGLPEIDPLPTDTASSADGRNTRARMPDYGYTLAAHAALDTLQQVLEGMKRLPGRKSLVFFSDSLRMDQGINLAIDRITDMANRSGVSLYTVDPGGLRARPIGGQEGLGALAGRTGGLFFHNRNDIAECIRQAADDQMGYYLLGYSPQEGTFEKIPGKAKFHKVIVRVHRAGLQVRWKSGFTGVADEAPGPEPASVAEAKTGEEQLLQALASPFTATGVKVRLTSMYFQTKKTGPFVRSLLHLDAKDLTFAQGAFGLWHATVDVVASAYRGFHLVPLRHGQLGLMAYDRQHRTEISLSGERYRRALKEGVIYVLDEPMKEPGLFLMRVAVRDAVSRRVGSASQSLQVPDTRKGQLAVSGITLQLATPELLRMAEAAPAGEGGKDGRVEEWSEGGPAVRRYRPGQNIAYGYQVINPTLKGPAKEPQVAIQVRVFRNGKLFYTSPLEHSLKRSEADPTSFFTGGVLSLKENLTMGEYLLQVVVTDQLGKKKTSQATQWIDFEVTAGPAL